MFRQVFSDWAINRGRPDIRAALALFRLAQELRCRPGLAARLLQIAVAGTYRIIAKSFIGFDMPVSTSVGPGLAIHHGSGLVVHNRAVLGAGVTLRHGVTVGTLSPDGPAPRIGDNVDIGAGSLVLGGVSVGAEARIGAGCVVLDEVPAGATAYGARAQVREARVREEG